jgi:photosystem II stability/assembly factor-like uncharacterized protein
LKYSAKFSGHYWRLAITEIGGVDRVISTLSPWDDSPNCVVISEDSGKTYAATRAGLPDYPLAVNSNWGKGYPRGLAVDPKNPQVVYLGMDGDPDGPKKGGGLFKSTDGGRTWQQLPNQPGSRRVFHGLAVDPTEPKRLYWAGVGDKGGLYRSEDGGMTWELVFSQETWATNVRVTNDGVVYFPSSNLYRSTDHGRTWQQLSHSGGGLIQDVEVDPRDPRTIWISRDAGEHGVPASIYKSRDGGSTWTDITGDLQFRSKSILRFNPATNELWAVGPCVFKIKQ